MCHQPMFQPNLNRPRGCFNCNSPFHLAKWCHFKKNRTVKPTKSAIKKTKNNARLAAFNKHKSIVSELPFAHVKNNELPNLMPKPTSNMVHPRIMTMVPFELAEAQANSKFLAEIEHLKMENHNLQVVDDRWRNLLDRETEHSHKIASRLNKADTKYGQLNNKFKRLENKCEDLVAENDILEQELSKMKNLVQQSQQPDIETELPRQAEEWYDRRSFSKPGLPTLPRILDHPMAQSLSCFPKKRQIIRYQVDVEPFIWHDIQFEYEMPLGHVHEMIQQNLNIPLECMATFFMFGSQLYASLDPHVFVQAYPVDNKNSENGRILHMYIQTKGKLYETEDFSVRKQRFSNNGKRYYRR